MTQVRQIGNNSGTITVVNSETYERINMTIVAEDAGCYAVEYESDGRRIAGQFVDSKDSQELYESSEDSVFLTSDREYTAKVVSNDGSLRWIETTDR